MAVTLTSQIIMLRKLRLKLFVVTAILGGRSHTSGIYHVDGPMLRSPKLLHCYSLVVASSLERRVFNNVNFC